jgi:hypothetical protein
MGNLVFWARSTWEIITEENFSLLDWFKIVGLLDSLLVPDIIGFSFQGDAYA